VPIWITEIGWPATDDPTARQQARYDVRAVILGALAGADRVYVYTLEEGPNGTDDFGITGYADWDAGADTGAAADKPAFVALEALLGAVGDFVVSARLPASPTDVYVVELGKAGSKAWIACRSRGRRAAVRPDRAGPPAPQRFVARQGARHAGASNGSAKYCVSCATFPSRNSMMLTVGTGRPS
jgi:hypothetical protein